MITEGAYLIVHELRSDGSLCYVYRWDSERSFFGGYSERNSWYSERDPQVYDYLRGYIPPRYPVPAKIVRVIWGHDDDGVCRHALTAGHNNEGFSFYLGNSTASIEDDWYD